MEKWGVYLEWIDDVQDMLEDLMAGRWNVALLKLVSGKHIPDNASVDELRFHLHMCMADEAAIAGLTREGEAKLQTLIDHLHHSGLACDSVMQLLADLTTTALTRRG
jgi:hypothetical protein